MGEKLWLVLFFAMVIVRLRAEEGAAASSPKSSDLPQTKDVENEGKSNKTYNNVVVNNKRKNNGGGGGGGVFWRWGCNGRHRRFGKKRVFPKGDYARGEFAQCVVKGRCKGMRLDCPLHCGGPCVYDCRNVCKAHCEK